MRIVIVVCTHNQPDNMVATLASVGRLTVTSSVACSFTVVNNAAANMCSSELEAHVKTLPTSVLHEPTPGLSIARNTGVSQIDADYVIFTDDDVTVPADWLARYAAAFRRYPDAVFFGSDVVPVFADADASWARALSRSAGSCFARFRVGARDRKIDTQTNPRFYPFGANMAFRLDMLRQFRFDESLGRQPDGLVLSGEETKLIGEMVAAGHRGYLIADNPVNHCIAPSRQTLEYVRRYYYGQGWLQASIAVRTQGWTMKADRVLSPVVAYLFRQAQTVAGNLPGKNLRIWIERQHGHFSGRTAVFRDLPRT